MVLEKIFNFDKCIFTFSISPPPPLEKGVALHLNKLESPSLKDALCWILVEIGLVVREQKLKMWKSLQTDIQTKGDQKSLIKFSAQVSQKTNWC